MPTQEISSPTGDEIDDLSSHLGAAISESVVASRRNTTAQRGKLFISYARDDRLAVERLCNDLIKRRYDIWLDTGDIRTGTPWLKEVTKAIKEADGVIACVSPDFLTSKACLDEIELAQAERKQIYPVLVRRLKGQGDRSEQPIDLGELQHTDLQADYAKGIRTLINEIPLPRWKIRVRNAQMGLIIVALLMFIIVLGSVGALVPGRFFPTPSAIPTATAVPPTPTLGFAEGESDITVAVVPLYVTDPNVSVEASDAFTQNFSQLLETELRRSLQPLRLTLGYVPPTNVEPIIGQTPEERALQAGNIATDHGVTVVIYGVLSVEDGTTTVQPEFYVSTSAFFEAKEMTGGFRFGDTIPLCTSVLADECNTTVRRELSTRANALTQVVIGLRSYAESNFVGAQDAFQQALETAGISNMSGTEVIHMLLGNTYLRQAQAMARDCQRIPTLTQLKAAKAQFEQAHKLALDYARPYVGLAAATYLSALWSPRENDQCVEALIDIDQLIIALDYISSAVSARYQPPEEGVRARARLTEASVLFGLWNTLDVFTDSEYESYYNRLWAATGQIIGYYEDGTEVGMDSLAVEAYRLQGDALLFSGDPTGALEEYSLALHILGTDDTSTRSLFLHMMRGDGYCSLMQSENALTEYQAALRLAEQNQLVNQIPYIADIITKVESDESCR